jgi:hypothetical protein
VAALVSPSAAGARWLVLVLAVFLDVPLDGLLGGAEPGADGEGQVTEGGFEHCQTGADANEHVDCRIIADGRLPVGCGLSLFAGADRRPPAASGRVRSLCQQLQRDPCRAAAGEHELRPPGGVEEVPVEAEAIGF